MTIYHEEAMGTGGAAAGDRSQRGTLADRASTGAVEVASTATEGARQVAGELGSQAKAVMGEARQQFDGFITQARGEIREQAQQRNDQVATHLRTLSEQLTALAEGRPEGAGTLSGYVYDVEDQVRRLATRLEQRGPNGVMDDVTRFARRKPGVFLAGALGAGLLVGRAIRAGAFAQSTSVTDGQRSSGAVGYTTSPYAAGIDAGRADVGDGGAWAPESVPAAVGTFRSSERDAELRP